MDDIERNLLLNFAEHGSPCGIFSPRPDQKILAVLKRFAAEGLIRSIAGPMAVQGDNLWFECVVLTDEAGRVAAGLEPVRKPVKERLLFE